MPVKFYRVARWLHLHGVPVLPRCIKILNRIIFGVVLPPSATLGRDVLLSYQGLGTVIHRRAIIGDRTVIGTCVTIGGRSGMSGAPVIEEGAMIGSGAKVLGPVRIGRYAAVGANAVVLSDVPDFAVVVGVPSRIIKYMRPEEIPDYMDFER